MTRRFSKVAPSLNARRRPSTRVWATGSSSISCASSRDVVVTIAWSRMLRNCTSGRAIPAPPSGVKARKSMLSIVSSTWWTFHRDIDHVPHAPLYGRLIRRSRVASAHDVCHSRVVGFPHDTTTWLAITLVTWRPKVLHGFSAPS